MTRSRWLIVYTLVPTAVVRFPRVPEITPSWRAFVLDQADVKARKDTGDVLPLTAAAELDVEKLPAFSSSRFAAHSLC